MSAVQTNIGSSAGLAAQRFLPGGKLWSAVAGHPFSPRGQDALDTPGTLSNQRPSQQGYLQPTNSLRQEQVLGQDAQRRGSMGPPSSTGKRARADPIASAANSGLLHTPYIGDRNPKRSLVSSYNGGSRFDTQKNSAYGQLNKLQPMATPAATKAQYKVGMIFRTVLHEAHRRNGNARAGNTTDMSTIRDPKLASKIQQTTSTAYGNVHSKPRPMIVVVLYETHYVAVPLYTHEGTGLSHIKNPLEYVSIRDHRSREPFVKLSGWNPLVTGDMHDNTNLMNVLSTVKLTYPISRAYDAEGTRMGYLDRESTIYLTELYLYHAPQLLTPLELANTKASIKAETQKLDAAKQVLVTRKKALKSKREHGGDPSELFGIAQDTMQAQESLIKVFERKLTLIESITENTKPIPLQDSAPSARR